MKMGDEKLKKKVEKTEQKIVYKSNKKLIKKMLIWGLVIVLVLVFAAPVKYGITMLYYNSWKQYKVEDYNFSFKLPRAFEEQEVVKKESSMNLSSLLDESVSGELTEYLKKPDSVYRGGNILNGVSMLIQCLKTPRTTRTLDEIADSHEILLEINYGDNYEVKEKSREQVVVLGTDSIKTVSTIVNTKESNLYVSYLIPKEDMEITIMFYGSEKSITEASEQIEKIIASVK